MFAKIRKWRVSYPPFRPTGSFDRPYIPGVLDKNSQLWLNPPPPAQNVSSYSHSFLRLQISLIFCSLLKTLIEKFYNWNFNKYSLMGVEWKWFIVETWKINHFHSTPLVIIHQNFPFSSNSAVLLAPDWIALDVDYFTDRTFNLKKQSLFLK